jgi:hypothetical protein
MTFQDTTMKSDSIVPSSKDLKDLSKVILQENRWSVSKMQKEFDEVITDKNEEISRLKDHSQKLLTQIKKSKDRKQCIQKLEQKNQDLEKNLSEKNEENSRLKSMIKENNVIRTPYRHPNHKRRYLKQSEYQYHLGRKQLNYLPKNIDTSAIKSHDNSSSWKCNVPQRIELGWSNPFTVRKFCSALKVHIVSYHQLRQHQEQRIM